MLTNQHRVALEKLEMELGRISAQINAIEDEVSMTSEGLPTSDNMEALQLVHAAYEGAYEAMCRLAEFRTTPGL